MMIDDANIAIGIAGCNFHDEFNPTVNERKPLGHSSETLDQVMNNHWLLIHCFWDRDRDYVYKIISTHGVLDKILNHPPTVSGQPIVQISKAVLLFPQLRTHGCYWEKSSLQSLTALLSGLLVFDKYRLQLLSIVLFYSVEI